jgi:hypothetical protein
MEESSKGEELGRESQNHEQSPSTGMKENVTDVSSGEQREGVSVPLEKYQSLVEKVNLLEQRLSKMSPLGSTTAAFGALGIRSHLNGDDGIKFANKKDEEDYLESRESSFHNINYLVLLARRNEERAKRKFQLRYERQADLEVDKTEVPAISLDLNSKALEMLSNGTTLPLIRTEWGTFKTINDDLDSLLSPIEALVGEPEVTFGFQDDFSLKDGPPPAKKTRKLADREEFNDLGENLGANPLPERIRIRSPEVILVLKRILGSEPKGTNLTSGEPVALLRPFKTLVYYKSEIRAWAAKLDRRWGDLMSKDRTNMKVEHYSDPDNTGPSTEELDPEKRSGEKAVVH